MKISDIPLQIRENVKRGVVIPAHPMALDADRKFDVRQQRALTRYYLDAGVGGIAIGVHTTQFEIRDPKYALLNPVLTLASETVDEYCAKSGRSILKIAGVCGNTEQAVKEAAFANETGFHACLLNLGSLKEENLSELIAHCRAVAEIMPIFGFYLQPIAGGRLLSFDFWKQFAEIDNILAIKIAPFNRYQTLDVVRAVCEAGKEKDIALYTGNDDSILMDLLCEYKFGTGASAKTVRIVGGLLGHWAVWTKKAVEMLKMIHSITEKNAPVPSEILQLAGQVTDANAVLFDAANDFSGCIPGIHEILRRHGLLKGTWCLDANQTLSPGQSEEFDRIYRAYPEMNDDAFIKENLERWLQD